MALGIARSVTAAIFCSLAIGCPSRSEKELPVPTSAAVPTIVVPSPPADNGSRFDAGAVVNTWMPDPIIGSRSKEDPWRNPDAKVSDDGQIVAIWTNVAPPDQGEGDSKDRYLIAMRVDAGAEMFRMMVDRFPPSDVELCGPKRKECTESELATRRQRERQFLLKHSWTPLERFDMEFPEVKDEYNKSCSGPQRLVFPNLDVFFDDLVLRLSKPSGELFLERRFPGWSTYRGSPAPGDPKLYFIRFLAMDRARRVLLVGIGYCHPGAIDSNLRFHTIRLPPL